LYGIFGNQTFRIPSTGKLSRPMYDAFMVAYGLVDKDKLKASEAIKAELSTIDVNSTEYEILIGKGNTADSIRDRVALAKRILEVA